MFFTRRPWLAAGLTSLLIIFSFPSWNLGFLAWFALVPLLLLLPSLSLRRAFLWSGAAAWAAQAGLLAWVYSTCRAGGVNPFTSVLAWGALSFYLGLYGAVWGVAVNRSAAWPLWFRPLFAAALWVCLEWLRGHLLTGFPWLLFGYSQWKAPWLLGVASLGGPYAVSFMLVLFSGIAFEALKGRGKALSNLWPSVVLLAVFLAVNGALWLRPLRTAGPPVSVAIVQGNIDQYKKWDQAYEDDIVHVYDEMTRQAAKRRPALIVWPETAVPGWIPNEEKFTRWLKELAEKTNMFILAGAASHQGAHDYNAAFLLSPLGDFLAQYRKRHLVPFGEFIPFQSVLSKFTQVLNELGDFDASRDRTVFTVPGARFSVNICFEALFPRLVAAFVRHGAQMTVNITNDGWFLDTAAPEQHFLVNVFRAVETRTWVVRAANTGISGFIDPRGRVMETQPLMTRGVLMGRPEPMDEETFYTRWGDVFVLICLVLVVVGAVCYLLKK